MTKNVLRMAPVATTRRSGITQSKITATKATIPKAPVGGRTTATKPTKTPRRIATAAQTTIGATCVATRNAACAASFVSAHAVNANSDIAERFKVFDVTEVELPIASFTVPVA